MPEEAKACVIEIVERTRTATPPDGLGVIVPNELRINGTPVLVPKQYPPKIHEMDFGEKDCAMVTLTVFARVISVREEVAE